MKAGLAQMAKGGIIMDVTNPQEARIAEEAGVGSLADTKAACKTVILTSNITRGKA